MPTGYLGRFVGEGLGALGSPGISPDPPLTLSLAAFPAPGSLPYSPPTPTPRGVSSSLAWHCPLVTLHTHLPPSFSSSATFQKSLPSFSVPFCLCFSPSAVATRYYTVYLFTDLSFLLPGMQVHLYKQVMINIF